MISNSGTSTLGLYDFKRQIDAFGGVDYFRPNLVGGYLLNARVMLANGDIVKSTINGNTNDPNVDMTGWQLGQSWERKALSNAIKSVNQMLDTQVVSIWEFANLCNKRGSVKPDEWDWSPAIRTAIESCRYYAEWKIGSNTRYASQTLYFPPQKYRIYSSINVDWSSVAYLTGKPLFRMVGENAYFSNMMHEQFAFWLCGVSCYVRGFTFLNESGGNAFHLKLGDENRTNITSANGYFGDLKFLGQTKGIVIGQVFDCVFDLLFMTGFNTDNSTRAYGIEILAHINDNSNNIVFNRLHLETTYTADYTAFKIHGNATNSSHHNIRVFGGHFENHFYGSKLLDIGKSNGVTFYGTVFNENGDNTDYTVGGYEVFTLTDTHNLTFDNCIIQSLKRSNASFNATTMKSYIGIYGGNSTHINFKDSHLVHYFSDGPSSNDLTAMINSSGCTKGRFSYNLDKCSFNVFSRSLNTGYSALSGISNITRKFVNWTSDDGLFLNFGFDNNWDTINPTVLGTLSSLGKLKFPEIEAGTLRSIATTGRVSELTADSDISDYYYPNPANKAGSYTKFTAYSSSGFGIQTVGGFLRLNSDTGVRFYSKFVPNQTATHSIGEASLTVNNIFLQNAPTVVSDERYKSNIRVIDEELLDAWGALDFKMWQLNAAVEEKGTENARWHTGYIAQHIKDVLTNAGLEWTRYGLITYESWDTTEGQEAVYDSENNLISEAIEPRDAGEVYMLRMEECFAVESAYQRRRLDRIEAALNL